MVFSPINFLQAPIVNKDFSGLGNLFANYQQAKQNQIQNQLAGISTKYAEPSALEALESQKAQTQLNRAKAQEALSKMAILQRYGILPPGGLGEESPNVFQQYGGEEGLSPVSYEQMSAYPQMNTADTLADALSDPTKGPLLKAFFGLEEHPAVTEKRKEIGKKDAEIYGEVLNSLKAGTEVETSIDSIVNIISEAGPDFLQATGPFADAYYKRFGAPALQYLNGQLSSLSGNITLAYAGSLKGAFTGRDQDLISSIKANPKDPPAVFLGKLNAMKNIVSLMNKRNELISEYISRGLPPSQAIKEARKITPLEGSRKEESEEKNIFKEYAQHAGEKSPTEVIKESIEGAFKKGTPEYIPEGKIPLFLNNKQYYVEPGSEEAIRLQGAGATLSQYPYGKPGSKSKKEKKRPITEDAIKFTAKKHGISEEEVRKRLKKSGAQEGRK